MIRQSWLRLVCSRVLGLPRVWSFGLGFTDRFLARTGAGWTAQ